MSPEEDRTRDAVDSEPKHYQLSYSGPPILFLKNHEAFSPSHQQGEYFPLKTTTEKQQRRAERQTKVVMCWLREVRLTSTRGMILVSDGSTLSSSGSLGLSGNLQHVHTHTVTTATCNMYTPLPLLQPATRTHPYCHHCNLQHVHTPYHYCNLQHVHTHTVTTATCNT